MDTRSQGSSSARKPRRRTARKRAASTRICLFACILIFLAFGAWVGTRAILISNELRDASALVPALKESISSNDPNAVARTVDSLKQHTNRARDAANDPLWKASSLIPWLGANVSAASEVAISADDVAEHAAKPLADVFQSLDWTSLRPTPEGINLGPIGSAAPKVQAAAHAVRESTRRLDRIDSTKLLPQISEPLSEARNELFSLSGQLDAAADAAKLAPPMLGIDKPRRYLLLVQNNAEARATGGIPGALAVLTLDHGKLILESQTSAGALGQFVPPLAIGAEEKAIYSPRVGKFMQDVNLTPDFATTAPTAKSMWEKKIGGEVDGVVSIDPVALSYLLEATGPVEVKDPAVIQISRGLPTELNSKNVVKTLLSDAYSVIEDPDLQDLYFAGAAKEIFSALSDGKSDAKELTEAVARGVEERRILLWSADEPEQSVLAKYPVAGLVSGPSVAPAQFGVYFNDGTGAKMDYWVKRSVRVVQDCTRDGGYREITIQVTSTNTAPKNAGESLPDYVTGVGAYGVPPGSAQTNVVVYGPSQSTIDTVVKDGGKIPFAAHKHSQRGVGASTVRLGPGESTTLDFKFGHIVQEAKPNVVVTPTTQAVKDVLLAPKLEPCE